MPHTCFVNGCTKRSDFPGVKRSFYTVPVIINHQGEKTSEMSTKRSEAWIAAINRQTGVKIFKGLLRPLCHAHRRSCIQTDPISLGKQLPSLIVIGKSIHIPALSAFAVHKTKQGCCMILSLMTFSKRPIIRIFVAFLGSFVLYGLFWSTSQLLFHKSECSMGALLTSIADSVRTNGDVQLDDVLEHPCWRQADDREITLKQLEESIRYVSQTCSKNIVFKQRRASTTPILTLFTTWEPSPDKYHLHNITLMNWNQLLPQINLILFTNDISLGRTVGKYGWTVLTTNHTGAGGIPILKSMFKTASLTFDSSFYAYANADILFDNDLIETLSLIKDELGTSQPVMVTGRRTNVRDILMSEVLSYDSFQNMARERGELFITDAQDFFVVTPHYPWDGVPDLVVGRVGYDNWIIAHARCSNFTVIDVTKTVLAVHQTTKYGNLEGFLHKNAYYNRDLLKNSGKSTHYTTGFTKCIESRSYKTYCGEKKIGKRSYIPYDCSCSQWT